MHEYPFLPSVNHYSAVKTQVTHVAAGSLVHSSMKQLGVSPLPPASKLCVWFKFSQRFALPSLDSSLISYLKSVVVLLYSLSFLEQGLGTKWYVQTQANHALRFPDESQNLRVKVHEQLLGFGMAYEEGGLETRLCYFHLRSYKKEFVKIAPCFQLCCLPAQFKSHQHFTLKQGDVQFPQECELKKNTGNTTLESNP